MEGMVGEKAVREEGKKRHYKSLSLKFDNQAVLAIDCELISIVCRKKVRLGWHRATKSYLVVFHGIFGKECALQP